MDKVVGHVTDIDYWQNKWDINDIRFHRKDNHVLLVKYKDLLIDDLTEAKIFFPLCGKNVDMIWLYDEGHTIVGVEIVENACRQFFSENEIEYTISKCPELNGQVFKSKDGRISLYNGDFFKFGANLEGKFDCFWDRGALVAMNVEDHQKYVNVLKSLMHERSRMLLDTFRYDPSLLKGPPHLVPDEEVHTLYGDTCDIIKLEESSAKEIGQPIPPPLDEFYEILHLICKKC